MSDGDRPDGGGYRDRLRKVAEDNYDWIPVARRLKQLLHEVAEMTVAD